MLGMSLVAVSRSMLTSTKAPAAISTVGKKALVIFNQQILCGEIQLLTCHGHSPSDSVITQQFLKTNCLRNGLGNDPAHQLKSSFTDGSEFIV